MEKYFNVYLEFDKKKIHTTIEDTIADHKKGYVCAIESNNLAVANRKKEFQDIVNQSLINICDGSNIAMLLRLLHKKEFHSYVGNDIFEYYIKARKYKHYFLGNTPEILSSLKQNLSFIDPAIEKMKFESLPFRKVEEFDYEAISTLINSIEPDLIWVSLGAPKQEIFMANLLPYLNKGVMIGVGAAFNFMASTGTVKRAPKWMRRINLEWLYRACEEPQKNIPRYWNFIKLIPSLANQERKKIKAYKKSLKDFT